MTRVHFRELGESESIGVDAVLNTAPLNSLVQWFSPAAPPAVVDAAARLDHVAILFVYLEVQRPRVSPDHWIYLPERHLRVHRVSEFKNFSDTTAPGPTTAVCCEITCRVGDATWELGDEAAGKLAMRDLERCGLLEPGEARLLDIARAPRAYPVYDLDYRPRLDALRAHVAGIENLATTGRQGLFRYNNMDHSILMGRHAARRIDRSTTNEAPELSAGYMG